MILPLHFTSLHSTPLQCEAEVSPGYTMPLHITRSHTHTRDYNTHPTPLAKPQRSQGFTLIELSIVLVIIGLITGGILVGQDLIKAAETRGQISQIEKFNTAVNTFKGKYGYLPGDIPDPYATQFGFGARGIYIGQGDGNGMISGYYSPSYIATFGWHQQGENTVLWVDLSTAKLIDGNFSTASPISAPGTDVSGSGLNSYFPAARLGNNLYVYIMSGYTNSPSHMALPNYAGSNFFVVSAVQSINYGSGNSHVTSKPGISVLQAYTVDKKIDDALPLSGKVTTASASANGGYGSYWFSNGDVKIESNTTTYPSGNNIAGSGTTCYDNNASSANTVKYSLTQNNGAGLNCSLSFQFQ